MPWGINQPRIAPIYQEAYDRGAEDFNELKTWQPGKSCPFQNDPEKDDWEYDYGMGFDDAENSYYS
jgi:hypothetical protein